MPEEKFSKNQLSKAFRAAFQYYRIAWKDKNAPLPNQSKVAKDSKISASRFSEYINIAWKTGMIDVLVRPHRIFAGELEEDKNFLAISADIGARDNLENRLNQLLRSVSPQTRTNNTEVKSRFIEAHIVPNLIGKVFNPSKKENFHPGDYGSVASRISRKAAQKFLDVLDEYYNKNKKTYCTIGWGRSAESVVDFFKMPNKIYANLTVCPSIGMISTRQHSMDANFLAFRLASRLSGEAIKLPGPVVQDYNMGLEKLKPIDEALNEIAKCKIGISAIGVPEERLMKRDFYTPEQAERIEQSLAVAEVNCNYLDANGELISFEQLGFEPLGLSFNQMKAMERYMIVVSPDVRKVPAIVAAVKAGICTDVVLDHRMAHEILAKYGSNNK